MVGIGKADEVKKVGLILLQGDNLGYSLGFIDLKAKVAFQYKEHTLRKEPLFLMSTKPWVQPERSPCKYMSVLMKI